MFQDRVPKPFPEEWRLLLPTGGQIHINAHGFWNAMFIQQSHMGVRSVVSTYFWPFSVSSPFLIIRTSVIPDPPEGQSGIEVLMASLDIKYCAKWVA